MLYRIDTEYQPNLYELVSKAGFNGFNLIHGVSFWKGQKGISATIEIELSGNGFENAKRIETLAAKIARRNKEEAVLVTVIPSTSKLIEGSANIIELSGKTRVRTTKRHTRNV